MICMSLDPILFLKEIGNDWNFQIFSLIGFVRRPKHNQPEQGSAYCPKPKGDNRYDGDQNIENNIKRDCLYSMVLNKWASFLILHEEGDEGKRRKWIP